MSKSTTMFAAMTVMLWMAGCGDHDPVSSQNEGMDAPSAKLSPSMQLVGSRESRKHPTPKPTQGIWTATGSMVAPRRDHSATLLKNGKVLIVGGTSQTAELYDPDTGIFTVTGTPRFDHFQGHTATRLNNLKVLVVGGNRAETSAEIYNPITGVFSATGNPNAGHSGHTATILPNGRVLIAGGNPGIIGQTINTAEIYSPGQGTFSMSGNLNVDRAGHNATLLPNGKVLITGGFQSTTPGNGNGLSSADLFDPHTETFSLVGNTLLAHFGETAILLDNGKVLVAGGFSPGSAELYDPTTETFALTGTMTESRAAFGATRLRTGQVLLVGGSTAIGPVTTRSAELYDPDMETFTATSSMTSARQECTATLLLDGRVLVVGGSDGRNDLASAEIFELSH